MVKLPHPYKGFKGSVLYKRLDKAILALAENGDIRIITRREYVAAYMCHALTQHAPRAKRRRARA